MLDTLDAAAVRRWCGAGLAALRAHQREIDELNVYPVPDGDTGTNLVLTLTSAHQAIDGEGGGKPERVMRRMARGALLGARGNSGVIVSQILRGMADAFATSVSVRGRELARALRKASDAAYAAVARPVEGTVLSVVAAAAEGASRIKSDDLLAVARAAALAAREALARTPQQLPVLARAGVVDAGGRGLVLLLDALVEALTTPADRDPAHAAAIGQPEEPHDPAGGEVLRPEVTSTTAGGEAERPQVTSTTADGEAERLEVTSSTAGGEIEWLEVTSSTAGGGIGQAHEAGGESFEVQYLLDATDEAVAALRGRLDGLGDSLVIVGTGDGALPTWNVHVHVGVRDIGAALEAGIEAGRPHRITVTPLTDAGHAHHPPGHEHADDPAPREHAGGPAASDAGATTGAPAEAYGHMHFDRSEAGAGQRGVVVVASGDGLSELFTGEGAVVVGHNPSIAEMLAAVDATGADEVVLLPNDANTQEVARAAAKEATRARGSVRVVPTRSPVQALAALAVRDPQRRFDEDVIAMAEAAGACRHGEVTTAAREALTLAGRCRPGELLGLVDGEVIVIGAEWEEVCRRLLDRMLGGGGELVTVVLGADAPPSLESVLGGHLAQAWPFVELQCYAGGQPRYHLLVGVE